MKVPDLVGKIFGRLLIQERSGSTIYGKARWKCLCGCGNTTYVETGKLTNGHTQSCGCLNKEIVIQKNKDTAKYNGESYGRIYRIWLGIIRRCNNKSYYYYHRYGGRGISLCLEWKDYFTFKSWALNNGYQENLSIDRINNDGNYEPSNCKWSTAKEQANNTSRNIKNKINKNLLEDKNNGLSTER